jgi:hypothetical protein
VKTFAIRFLVLRDREALSGVAAKAARVDGQHVDAGLALDDPLGELPAGAARRRDAEAVSFVDPHVAQPPCRTDHGAAVGRVGNRAVHDRLDAAVLEAWHALHRRFDVRQQPIEIAGEELLAERRRHAVGKPSGCALLVGPEDPAQPLLAQIVRGVRFAQHRELALAPLAAFSIRLQFFGFVVDDVLVLDGNRGERDTELAAGLARVVAGGAHDVLARHLAGIRRELPFARRRARDALHFRLLADLRAEVARAAAQRHREVHGRDVAVVRMVERADDLRRVDPVAQVDERPQLLHLRR